MLDFSGRFAPLVTPFTDDGSMVSEIRIARQVRHVMQLGCEGFVTTSETGEFGALSFSERKAVFEAVMRESQGQLPILAHVSSLSTSASLDLAQHAGRHGARCAVLMPPYYGPITQREIVEHIRVVAAYSKIGIVVVDPLGQIYEDAATAITHIPNVQIAWHGPEYPFVASDCFRCKALEVDPSFLVPGSGAQDFVLRNRAAVAKALLQDMGLDMGSPRMPVQPIPANELRKSA